MKLRTTVQLPSIAGLVLLCICVFVAGISLVVSVQKYAAFHNTKGVHYYESGNLELAVDSYTKAIRLNPDYAQAYFNRGNACYDMGEWELALQDYRRYLQLEPAATNRAEVVLLIDELESELIP